LARIGNVNCLNSQSQPIWTQAFTFDAFGNVKKTGNNGGTSFLPNYSSTTNRMTSLGGLTPTYDANGNLTYDTYHTYSWDSAGKPVAVGSIGLTYDALGRMVEQNRSGSYTQVVYSAGGSKLALMSGQTLSKAFVSLPAGAQAVYTSGLTLSYYRHPDWLGSSRYASTSSRTTYFDTAFAPYGEPYAGSGTTDLSFTAQNADTVADEYDFLNREYHYLQGRWVSPDPAGVAAADITNPQSLNRYAYVVNRPSFLIDSTGLSPNCEFAPVHGRAMPSTMPGTGCGGIYEGNGGNTSIDNGDVPAGLFGGGTAGGGDESAVACPNSGCLTLGIDTLTGQPAILEFFAGAGGAVGYLSGYDISRGLNEVNGTFLTDAAYQTYLQSNFLDAIKAQLAATIAALKAANVNPDQIQAFANYMNANFNLISVHGGNADFPDSGRGFDFSNLGCPEDRCDLGALGTLDFSHGGSFHLDTADPYNFWGGGTFLHFAVDIILGNVVYYVIPR
jgi:RHS repeat-associated protein